MATQKETVEFILDKLGDKRFTVRAMFGEYALYANGKVVGLICDDLLYVKILPPSAELENHCEKGNPYPGARLHYIVEEGMLDNSDMASLLLDISASLPAKKKAAKKRRSRA